MYPTYAFARPLPQQAVVGFPCIHIHPFSRGCLRVIMRFSRYIETLLYSWVSLSMCSWMPPLSDLPYLAVSQGLEPLQSMAAFFSFFSKEGRSLCIIMS